MLQETDYRNRIICGDSREVLKQLPDEIFQTCITSPPYWGLRDYGTAEWNGGNRECNHQVGRATRTLTAKSHKQTTNTGSYGDESIKQGGRCPKCGARRVDRQIGLEDSIEKYVEEITSIFREVRRTLRNDGTLWLNMGDKIESKNLCGIPWRVAFALQADGWYLRCDIIWSKPNPMPESVTDRPTKAHEYVFLMSKSQRYYYNADAIREPWTCNRDDMRTKGVRTGLGYLGSSLDNSSKDVFFGEGQRQSGETPQGRNARSVWEIPTHGFKEAHFATFPEALVNPCILAGSKERDLILDPFGGSGTVGYRAKEMARDFTMIELNSEYVEMAERRLSQGVLL